MSAPAAVTRLPFTLHLHHPRHRDCYPPPGAIKNKIATMTAKCYAAESLAYMLAANMDRGMTDYQIEVGA